MATNHKGPSPLKRGHGRFRSGVGGEVKLIVTALFLLFGVSGCTTAGTGNVIAEIKPELVNITLKFGANMSGPWKGRVELRRSPNESTVTIIGEGADVDRTPGHKATTAVVKESLTTLKSAADAYASGPGAGQRPLSAGSSGARRGIAP